MNDNNWFDINEIANYLQAKIGENQVSKSTLRRWIRAEADNSHDPQATKIFTTSALGSKKPVTKYSLRLVNAMIEHNLNRIQKKSDTIPPALLANLSNGNQAALQKELDDIKHDLANMHSQFQKFDDLAKRQYRQQLWLQIAQVKLEADRQGQRLDAQGLYQDMLDDDFHQDIQQYLLAKSPNPLVKGLDQKQGQDFLKGQARRDIDDQPQGLGYLDHDDGKH